MTSSTNKTDNVFTSNTLFHFTDDIDKLVNIITSGFYPHFSLEDFSELYGHKAKFSISMVCFCDLPLSRINNHLNIYGNYGIGLTKKWGIRNGISPVLYVHKNSKSWKAIHSIVTSMTNAGFEHIEKENINNINRIHSFIKIYEGKFLKKKIIKNYRFYNEREWRYVPTFKEHWSLLTPSDFRKLSVKHKYLLYFQPEDIKYLIVEKESDVPKLFNWIMQTFKKTYMAKQLITKIISSESLKEDF